MPIHRDHIQILFQQYKESCLMPHRVLAPAPEISLYQEMLESSADYADYVTTLCDIIHGHFHWRISGYSKVLNRVVNATIRAGRVATVAAHRGAAVAKTAAHHGAILAEKAAHDAARISARAAIIGLEIAHRRAIQAHAALHAYLPTLHTFQMLPPPAAAAAQRAAAAIFATTQRRVTPALPPAASAARAAHASPTHSEDEDGFTHVSMPPDFPASPSRSLRPMTDPKYEDPAVLLDYADIPADVDGAEHTADTFDVDRRIILFNHIVEHVALNAPVIFQNQVMSPTFRKMIKTHIKMRGGSYIKYVVYQELFLPPAMCFRLDQSDYRSHTPTAPPDTPLPPSPTKDTGTVAGYSIPHFG